MTPYTPAGNPEIYPSILEAVGHTPLVRLTRAVDVEATVLAKVEFLNPGGSVKDRIGVAMVDAAVREGRLRPGGTIVEATSGNTGMGLAIVAALRGYQAVFVMPDKMSDEKIRLLRSFGARVVITPTAVAPDDPHSYYSVARRIAAETPNAILADQYFNPANPQAHYETTGPEIWDQTQGTVTHFLCGLGTGGTITGVGRYLKEMNPAVQIVGVDPVGSVLHDVFYTGVMPPAHTYKVEGIGEDFIPGAYDFKVIDDIVQVTDGESFRMARRLVRDEGLFAGGSSGSAVVGAVRYIRSRGLGADAVVVVLLPDSGYRYLSKFLDDDWMREHGFAPTEEIRGVVADVLAARPAGSVITAPETATVTEVIDLMKAHDISQVPVMDAGGELRGVVAERDVLAYILDGEGRRDDPVAAIVSNRLAVVERTTTLAVLGQLFVNGDVAVVLDDGHPSAVLTKIDLIDFLARRVTS